MVTVANDRLVMTLEVMVNNALKSLGLMEKKVARFGSAIEKMGTRNLVSMSDAADKTFGKATNGLNSMSRAVDRTSENFNKIAAKQPFSLAEHGIDQMLPKMNKFDGTFKKINATTKKATKSMGGMNSAMMGFGLSMLFTGMALKNFAQNVIKTLGNTFMLLADEMNMGVARTLELQAATQYLKFILFDTFANTDMYANFVEFIVNAVNRVSEFVQLHPKLTQMIAVFLGIGIVLGGVTMVLGQMALLAVGLQIGLGTLIMILIILASVIALVFLIFTTNISDTWKFVLVLGTVFIGLIAILALAGMKMGWLGKMIIWLSKNPLVLIILTLVILANQVEALGGGFKGFWNLVKAVFAGIAKIVVWLANTIIQKLIDKMFWLVKVAWKVANALGFGGLADSLSSVAKSMIDMSDAVDDLTLRALKDIEKDYGINEMRVKHGLSTDASDLLGQMTMGISPSDTSGSGSSLLSSMKSSTEGVTATNMASSFNALDDHQKESNELLKSMTTDGVNFVDDGVTRMSKAMGIEVSKELAQSLFIEGYLIPSTDR